MPRHSPYDMWPVKDAQRCILEHAAPRPVTRMPLAAAAGLVLAQDVLATEPQPAFRASMKDGYAVRAKDCPAVLRLLDEVDAGRDAAAQPIAAGTTSYIATGAVVPDGADAVVMMENTEVLADSGEIRILAEGVTPGLDIRAVGSDVAVGDVIVERGSRLGAAEIGLLASCGVVDVDVHPQPRVTVLSTGNELVDAAAGDAPLPMGKIRDSNRPMLLAAARETLGSSASVVDGGIASDERAALKLRLEDALAASDVVLTSGGVSMGQLDLVKPLLEELGTVHFGRVCMKPGKPLTFATVGEKLVFGLPGNPVSSLVTYHLAVVPALRKMAGQNERLWQPTIDVRLSTALRLDPNRPEYHRASVTWTGEAYEAVSTGVQRSSRLLSMRSADVLIMLPQRAGELPAGETVKAIAL